MKHEENYETKDFYLAAVVMAAGNRLQNLRKLESSGSVYFFIFSVSKEKAEQLIGQHWSRKLTVHSKDLIDAIKELKTRIYEGR